MSTSGDDDGLFPTKRHVDACRRCDLGEPATQGVGGEGDAHARVLLVGEQPGAEEDLAGRPFVGPSGRLLRELLQQAGLAPGSVYLTNAVKHFRFELRGKRRLHKTPLQRHVAACHAWLEAELRDVRPRVIVTLGATALVAVLERKLSIVGARAARLRDPRYGLPVIATYHPSAVLRAPDDAARHELRAALLHDLQRAARIAQRDK